MMQIQLTVNPKMNKKQTVSVTHHNWIAKKPLGKSPVYCPTFICFDFSIVGNLMNYQEAYLLNQIISKDLFVVNHSRAPSHDSLFNFRSKATMSSRRVEITWKVLGLNWVELMAALNRTENPGGNESFEGIYQLTGKVDTLLIKSCSLVDSINICVGPDYIDKRFDKMDSIFLSLLLFSFTSKRSRNKCPEIQVTGVTLSICSSVDDSTIGHKSTTWVSPSLAYRLSIFSLFSNLKIWRLLLVYISLLKDLLKLKISRSNVSL